MKRRDFLKNGIKIGVAANALPIMMGGLPLRALGRSPLRNSLSGSTNNNVLVIIQLQGGNDGLNCVVPYADPNYAALRPTLGLTLKASSNSNSQGGNLFALPSPNDSLAFHWAMSGFSQLFNSNKMALVQNVGYPNPILSHFRGTDIWNTATDSNIYTSTGWVGRFLAGQYTTLPTTSGAWPLAVEFGSSLSDMFLAANGGMGIAMPSMPSSGSPAGENFDAIPNNPTTQYKELAFVRLIQQESAIYSAAIAGRSQSTNKVTYPTSTLATQLAGVAQMIASNGESTVSGKTYTAAPPKIYLVTQGSYDTHSTQITNQATLLGELAAAVLAFQQDLEAFGIADNVAIMTYSEFGRRPLENGSGTDHGTAAPHFIIGTQVNPGVFGSNPKLDAATLAGGNPAGNLTYDANYDFRNVYATVINEWLLAGQDQSQIDASIDDIFTQNGNAIYSTTKSWNASLGFFKQSSGVTPTSQAPGLMLLQNYPNPAIGATQIDYTLDAAGSVALGIYTAAGVEIARPVEGWQSIGNHTASFDASKLPSGAYFYRLTTNSGTLTRPMVVAH